MPPPLDHQSSFSLDNHLIITLIITDHRAHPPCEDFPPGSAVSPPSLPHLMIITFNMIILLSLIIVINHQCTHSLDSEASDPPPLLHLSALVAGSITISNIIAVFIAFIMIILSCVIIMITKITAASHHRIHYDQIIIGHHDHDHA